MLVAGLAPSLVSTFTNLAALVGCSSTWLTKWKWVAAVAVDWKPQQSSRYFCCQRVEKQLLTTNGFPIHDHSSMESFVHHEPPEIRKQLLCSRFGEWGGILNAYIIYLALHFHSELHPWPSNWKHIKINIINPSHSHLTTFPFFTSYPAATPIRKKATKLFSISLRICFFKHFGLKKNAGKWHL